MEGSSNPSTTSNIFETKLNNADYKSYIIDDINPENMFQYLKDRHILDEEYLDFYSNINRCSKCMSILLKSDYFNFCIKIRDFEDLNTVEGRYKLQMFSESFRSEHNLFHNG